jgi:hypothetical protein
MSISWHRFFFAFLLLGVNAAFAQFKPGQVWPDNQGVHINAHGGGVLFDNGVYYWFGEHKTEGSAGNVAHVGVHVYASKNLYDWQDKGIALAVSKDPASDITEGCILERPKVLRCPKTGKYVMFFHLELKGKGYDTARTGIAVSDTAAGPYRFLRSVRPNAGHWPLNVKPEQTTPEAIAAAKRNLPISNGPSEKGKGVDVFIANYAEGQMSRDMTLFKDDDGKAYHIFASEHNSTVQIAELTDDYLDYTGRYARALEKTWTEGLAVCKRQGVYYMIGSGCTGWEPNAARAFKATNIFGPWTSLGNPCRGVNPQNNLGPEKTWGGQSTFILEVNPDTYIAMFDIWRPENAIDGRYAWLPITFTAGGISITWQNVWSLK